MFEEIKQIEDNYEKRLGFKPKDKPYDKPSFTGLLISALYAIAREVRDVRKELDEVKLAVYGKSS